MRQLLIIGFILTGLIGFGQDSDSIQSRYNKRELKPRFGLSYQKGVFAEIGLSLNKNKIEIQNNKQDPFFYCKSEGIYISSDILVHTEKTILGPKIGYEIIGIRPEYSLILALEFADYTDFNVNSFVQSFNFGVSLKYFEIRLGYNRISNKDLKDFIGRFKLSITTNLNRLYWSKEKDVRKEYLKTKNAT